MPPRTRNQQQQQQQAAAAAASDSDQLPATHHDHGGVDSPAAPSASSHRSVVDQTERLGAAHHMQSPLHPSQAHLAQTFASPHEHGGLGFSEMGNQSLLLQPHHSHHHHHHAHPHHHHPQHASSHQHDLHQSLPAGSQSQPQGYSQANYGADMLGRNEYGGHLAQHNQADHRDPGRAAAQPGLHQDQLMAMQPPQPQAQHPHSRSAAQVFRPASRSLGQVSEAAAAAQLEGLSSVNTTAGRSDGANSANAQAMDGLLRLSSLSTSRSAPQHGALTNTYGSSTPTSMTTSVSFSGTHTPSLSRSLSPTSSITSSFTNGTGQSLGSSAAAVLANSSAAKMKKRLSNVDRKMICEYARDNPHERQEVVGNHFGIERSTVSKIMKDKDKWLAIDVEREGHVVKHRNARFPEIEKEVCLWLSKEPTRPSDRAVMNKAAEVAAAHGELTFKASAGWLVKFRERLGRQGLRFGHLPPRKTVTSNLHLISPGTSSARQSYQASPLGSPVAPASSSIGFLDATNAANMIEHRPSDSGLHPGAWSGQSQHFESVTEPTLGGADEQSAQSHTQTTPRASKRRAETMLQPVPVPASAQFTGDVARGNEVVPEVAHHALGKRQRGKKARTTPDATATMAINQPEVVSAMPSSLPMPLFDQRESATVSDVDKARQALELAFGTQDGREIQIPAELLEQSRALRERDLHNSPSAEHDFARGHPHEQHRSVQEPGRRHTRSTQGAQREYAHQDLAEETERRKAALDSGLSTPNHPHDDSGMQIDSRTPSGSPSDRAGPTRSSRSKGKATEASRAVLASLGCALPALGLQLEASSKRSSSASSSGTGRSSIARVSVNEAQTCVDTIIRFLQEHPSLSQKADDFLYWGTLKGYLNAMVEQERHDDDEDDHSDEAATCSQQKRSSK